MAGTRYKLIMYNDCLKMYYLVQLIYYNTHLSEEGICFNLGRRVEVREPPLRRHSVWWGPASPPYALQTNSLSPPPVTT